MEKISVLAGVLPKFWTRVTERSESTDKSSARLQFKLASLILMCAKQHKLQSTMQSYQTAPQPVFALPFLLQPLLADILPQCHRPLTRMLPGLLRNLQTLGLRRPCLYRVVLLVAKAHRHSRPAVAELRGWKLCVNKDGS